jgi:hypothetical protein
VTAYNKDLDVILIEAIYGEAFTDGWRVVLK